MSTNGISPASIVVCARCQDYWSWLVQYADERILHECQGTSMPHAAWANVDQPQVRYIVLMPRRAGLEQVVEGVPPDTTPVFFRRRYKELSMASGEQVSQQTIHCVGYERADGSGNYVFVFEDGSVLHTTDRNAV